MGEIGKQNISGDSRIRLIRNQFVRSAALITSLISAALIVLSIATQQYAELLKNIFYCSTLQFIYWDVRRTGNADRGSAILLVFCFIVELIAVFTPAPTTYIVLLFILYPPLVYVLVNQKFATRITIAYGAVMLICMYLSPNPLSVWSAAMFLVSLLYLTVISISYFGLLEKVVAELNITVSELEFQKKQINEIAIRDELTGLFNRRWFNEQFSREIHRGHRINSCLGFFMLDVDFFKQYNDNYGHQAGDRALQKVAEILQRELRRAGDQLFRLGGEEFGGIVHGEHAEKLIEKCRTLCRAIESEQIEHNFSEAANVLTVSIGMVVLESVQDYRSEEELYRSADTALYEAKHSGRNRACIAGMVDSE